MERHSKTDIGRLQREIDDYFTRMLDPAQDADDFSWAAFLWLFAELQQLVRTQQSPRQVILELLDKARSAMVAHQLRLDAEIGGIQFRR